MEASKRAAYSKDAKRRVGGLSTVLAMTEPTGPLPSSLPEGAPIPVATVPGALAPLGALHSQVGPASSLSAVGTSLSTPSPSELPPFPEPEPEPEPEEPEKMEAEEEEQSDEAMSEAGSSEAEETVMVVPEPAAEEEVTSPMEEEEEVGPQGLSPEVGDVVDPETRTRVLAQRYEVQKVVGEGAYGLVMKCKMRGSDTYVAIKEFKIEEDDPDADDVRRTSKREVDLLRNLQHPHVVGFIEEFYVKDKLFIVMEFVPCNLLEVLESHNGGLDKDMVRSVIYQLVKSIDFIHQKDIVYRDIKPENLLVTETGQVKLCDFGFARYVTRPDETLTDYVATRW
jgi:tRNA A-37 threonylcarbamoyl transferase component Bud32